MTGGRKGRGSDKTGSRVRAIKANRDERLSSLVVASPFAHKIRQSLGLRMMGSVLSRIVCAFSARRCARACLCHLAEESLITSCRHSLSHLIPQKLGVGEDVGAKARNGALARTNTCKRTQTPPPTPCDHAWAALTFRSSPLAPVSDVLSRFGQLRQTPTRAHANTHACTLTQTHTYTPARQAHTYTCPRRPSHSYNTATVIVIRNTLLHHGIAPRESTEAKK